MRVFESQKDAKASVVRVLYETFRDMANGRLTDLIAIGAKMGIRSRSVQEAAFAAVLL
jgi:hypothetical protein